MPRADRDVLKLAKRIISMFGSFTMGYGGAGTKPDPEQNVRADVESGKALLASDPKLTLTGLDTTTMVTLAETERARLLYRNSPLTDALCGLYVLWRFDEYARPDATLFDVVPVGTVLWPELFTSRPAHVRATDQHMAVLEDGKKPNCEIGVSFKRNESIKRIMERYRKQNLMRSPKF